MIVELLAFLVLVYLVLKLYWDRLLKPWQHIENAPVKMTPFLGQIPALIGQTGHEFLSSLHEWFESGVVKKDTLMVWLSSRPIAFTRDPKIFEYVMSSNVHISKSENYWIFKEWLGDALFTSTGDVWRKRRKLLTPSFHLHILTDFLPIMEKHSNQFVSCLREYARLEKTFDAFKVMKLYSIGIISETAMGVECNAIKTISSEDGNNGEDEAEISEELDYARCMDRLMEIFIIRDKTPWYWPKRLFLLFPLGQEYYKSMSTIRNFAMKMIEKRVEKLRETDPSDVTKERKIFLDKMLAHLQNGEIDDDEAVICEVETFLFAGYDTVASAFSWCFYLLGRNKVKQTKAYEEARRLSDAGLSLSEAVKEMSYIDAVIKESLRIHPSAPIISREIHEDVEINSVFYPKNTQIALCILECHRDPKIWDEPMKFKPERFLASEHCDGTRNKNNGGNYFSYVPFSAGPRNCIGQKFAMLEMKTTVYQILLKYEITALQKEEDLLEHGDIIHGVSNENGLELKFKFRE